MIFQSLAALFLLCVIVYGTFSPNGSRLQKLAVLFFGSGAIGLVLFPEWSSLIAQKFGIGRGSDLVFYCWGIITFTLFVKESIQLRRQEMDITKLSREFAIARALEELERSGKNPFGGEKLIDKARVRVHPENGLYG